MNSMQNKLENNNIRLFEILLSVYYLWFFLPFMRTTYGGIYKYIFFAFFLMGVALLVVENIHTYGLTAKVKQTIVAPILVYMAFMTFLFLFDIQEARDHIRVSFTFWGTALVYYFMGVTPGSRRRFAKLLIVLAVFTLITSSIVIWDDPRAARALTNSTQTNETIAEDYYLGRKNVSSIYLFQCLAAVSPIFVVLIKKKHAFLGLLGLILSFAILLKASFLIAVCVMVLGIVLALVQNEKSNVITFLISSIFVIVAFFMPWSEILSFLADKINNDTISARLDELSVWFKSGSATGDMQQRLDAYKISISTILRNPLGVGPYYFSSVAKRLIGKHSQIIDDVARYGVAALAFYWVFFRRYYALIKEKWSKIGYGSVVGPIVIAYIALLVLNIGFRSAEESAIMLFILPEIPEIVLYRKRKKELRERNGY